MPHEAGLTPTEVEAALDDLSVAFIQEVSSTRATTPDHDRDQIVRAQIAKSLSRSVGKQPLEAILLASAVGFAVAWLAPRR